MKKLIIVLITIIFFIPSQVLAFSISCRSCILMDMDSGRILYEKDIDKKRLIASTTKIMTAILAIESNRLNEEIIVGEEVLKMYGSNIYIELGEKMKLIDMLYGLMLRSGNDAAIVIATYIGGSEEEFVKMMNKKARELDMKNTTFSNCHGLDEETKNYSTARDLALLSSYASKNQIYNKIVGTKKYSVKTDKKSYIWYNRNKLLNEYKYATGGKTGYTPSAGKTLVTTASFNNLNLTAVTLNDGNQYESHKNLYNYGFENYKKYKILDKNKFKIDDYFYKNKIYIKEDFYYPLSSIEKDKVKVLVKLEKKENTKDNDKIGIVSVLLNNSEIYNEDVYVRVNNNKKTGIIDKIKELLFG